MLDENGDPVLDDHGTPIMQKSPYNMQGQLGAMADIGANYAVGMLRQNSYASEGGAIGGAIGSVIGGPFGTALGTLGGGLLGSLFGKSQEDPADAAYRRRIEQYLTSIDQSLKPVHDYFQTRVQSFSADSRYLSGRGLGFGDQVGAG